ncbi:NAD(P)H-quinone oxidoreductase [Pelagibacterium xiamenense]|uniref:NAD(P)H-quinone oxidoreductase n=1 Tax=Pelagibacterium xiamenense TaxID=2901140 RepID=UPI001E574FCD|nr:NAD(P)H-quinone oxidoreductase [Pelagibacterium xiamenense]MCD7060489.1 NAD(P)H-quinone oxidoreductase [Pelagibacterium xiamenense]
MTNHIAMRAIAIHEPGGPDVLRPVEVARPVPAAGEVLIRIAAAGVNGPDISQREGRYAPPPDASPLPGLEVSGVIEAAGNDVTAFAPGDAVVALTNGGAYAEYVTVPAGQVLPKPENWSWIEAAAIPETFFTIQQTLVERAGLAEGKTVLVHGGAGGIGATAIQMTRLFGGTAIATVSTAAKADYARRMGAGATINYRDEDFVERTRELTGGRGADIVIDIVGGSYTNRNLKAAAREGHILQLAIREGATSEVNMGLILMKALTVSGSTLRPKSSADKARYAAALEKTVWPAIADGRIYPPRTRSFPLESAADAHRAMEAPDHYGKIVLVTEFGAAL